MKDRKFELFFFKLSAINPIGKTYFAIFISCLGYLAAEERVQYYILPFFQTRTRT